MIEALNPDQRRILKNLILGSGSVMLLLLAAGTIAISYLSSRPERLRTLMSSLFDTLESEVQKSFSASVTPAERSEFETARERARKALLSGKMDSARVDELRRRLLVEARRGSFESRDVRALTQFLNSISVEAPPKTKPRIAA